jgi:hypothetical protein
MKKYTLFSWLVFLLLFTSNWINAQNTVPDGFTSLFNGTNFENWKVPDGDNGHWKIIDGVIDYDAESEAKGDKALWSEKEYQDFVLYVDWRIKATPYINPAVPIILPSGLHQRGPDGKEVRTAVPDSDSGIYIRGQGRSQVNIWCWPIGSGEMYGYRMDKKMPPEVRAGVTPKINADNPVGEWNTFKITVKGQYITVELNGKNVIKNVWLPDLPEKGAIALQHHGHKENGEWASPPSLVQFKNIYIKELPPETASSASSMGWSDLFKDDLSNAIYPDGIWSFKDGILTATEDQAIWTNKVYDNFVVDLEFMTEEGTNSGIIVYCSDIGDWIPNSVEVQIADDYAKKWADSPKNWQCGAIFGHLAASKSLVKKPGQWNNCRVTCMDNWIKVELNGELVTEMDMSKWTSAKTNPDGSEIPAWLSTPFSELPTFGHIGFQGKHAGANIFFRNLKVKAL